MKKVSEYAHRFMTILSMLFFACTLGTIFEFSVKGESILFIRNFFPLSGERTSLPSVYSRPITIFI